MARHTAALVFAWSLLAIGASPVSAEAPPEADGEPAPAPAAIPAADVAALRREMEAQRRELEALRARVDESAVATAARDDRDDRASMFRLYGYIDMGFQKAWTREDPLIPTRTSTFVLGNVNLYFAFTPSPSWSSLVEVRFTNYPRGVETFGVPGIGQRYERQDTAAADPGNGPGYETVSWGSIVLERAYIQWQKFDWLGVRVGQFLTPYGIWNVDHGSPTLISMYRPKFVSNQLWPSTQLGVEVFGQLSDVLPAPWSLEYHAYVSNGRTVGVVDSTEDKMVGGRAVASTRRPVPIAIGASAMMGRYSEQEVNVDVVTTATTRSEVIAYDEKGAAVDASIDLGGLRLRTELTLRDLHYDEGKRRPAWHPGIYEANRFEWDAYVLAAYRLPGTRLEPYAYVEAFHWPTLLGDTLATSSAGLNVYFTPSVQLKLQLSHERWVNSDHLEIDSDQKSVTFAAAKLVMAL